MSAPIREPWESWTFRGRVIASLFLAFHVFAIFAAPCASPPPSSYTWGWLAGRVDGVDGLLSPYLRAAYLNHGYRFFAPNPGPSHLVRYELTLDSGVPVDGQFPDPDEHWPRLLYHRMFMMSETLFNLAEPVREAPPPTLNSVELIEYQKQKGCADALMRGIARSLFAEYGGARVRLYIRTHEIPFPADVAAGQPLNHPSLYHERLVGEFERGQL